MLGDPGNSLPSLPPVPEQLRDFDFSLLSGRDFRENSVREEIVVPLLRGLGYSASPPHTIIRSRPLPHPYVYIGTSAKHITIIPDYILQRDSRNAWVLDAKAPLEIVDTGKSVEQAYSYAIHKDVRVPLYALCNGHRLVVFHISQWRLCPTNPSCPKTPDAAQKRPGGGALWGHFKATRGGSGSNGRKCALQLGQLCVQGSPTPGGGVE